jgi:hypothetical protein
VLPDDADLLAVLDAGVDEDAPPVDEAGAVRTEDPRLGDRRMSRWFIEAARSSTSTWPGPGSGSGASS